MAGKAKQRTKYTNSRTGAERLSSTPLGYPYVKHGGTEAAGDPSTGKTSTEGAKPGKGSK